MKAVIGNVVMTGYQKADGPGLGRKQCPHCGGFTMGARSLHCAHCGSQFTPQKKVVKTEDSPFSGYIALVGHYGGLKQAEESLARQMGEIQRLEAAIRVVRKFKEIVKL